MFNLVHYILDYPHPKGFAIDRPGGNDMYTILLFKQPVTMWQDGMLINAPKNSCIIFSRWAKQLYFNETSAYTHDGVFFDGEDPLDLFGELGIPLNTIFPVRDPKAISYLMKDIATEAMLKENYSPQIIDLQLHTLIYKLADIIHHSEQYENSYYAQFREIRHEIFRAPEKEYRVERLAERVHLSVSRFQHLYHAFFGTTLTQDLIQSRIEHAQYLLRSGNEPLTQIAAACGYNSTEHFLRQFKKTVGTTPGKYRAQML